MKDTEIKVALGNLYEDDTFINDTFNFNKSEFRAIASYYEAKIKEARAEAFKEVGKWLDGETYTSDGCSIFPCAQTYIAILAKGELPNG